MGSEVSLSFESIERQHYCFFIQKESDLSGSEKQTQILNPTEHVDVPATSESSSVLAQRTTVADPGLNLNDVA